MKQTDIEYRDVDESWTQRVASEWGANAAEHMHFTDGFSIIAFYAGKPIGLISVYWQTLPPPLIDTIEAYIDIIEVLATFRRRGIAKRMIEITVGRARAQGSHQLRAWSSEDKTEAIPMWKALGFGLCPATTYPLRQEIRGYFVTKIV
ncbi:MAG: GNAT family N-acetyltransferase [Chloroflexi bacterium]|nr:GNAT family N-acetyltransferase [Chloroflexota bacterium]MCL5275089.1 GNAT family N-acetyltransferase [Chloroflexota bacterium]